MNQFDGFLQQFWGQPEKTPSEGLLTQIMPASFEEPSNIQLSTKLEELIEQTRKQQAKHQAEAAQKVAETAAWWLFGTTFFSAAASAIAGFISIRA